MTFHDQLTAKIDGVFASITQRAVAVDQGQAKLVDDLQYLMRRGVLGKITAACMPAADWRQGFALLARIGAANLSVGRLVEGHVNAARLISLYGSFDQRRDYLHEGRLLGVWGADGASPLTIAKAISDGAVLHGGKSFCSGLGLVDTAVVTAPTPSGPQLLLIAADDPARQHPASWQVSGMRATASGDYSMDGLQAEALGKPGDQMIEPHFEGGVWRYLALHAGALRAIAQEATDRLRDGGATDLQKARLAQLSIAAGTAELWARHAARAAEEHPADTTAPATVLLAREAVEAACQDGIALAERLFGTMAFRSGTRIDLMRRDLAFFLRQANLDDKMLRVANALLERTGNSL